MHALNIPCHVEVLYPVRSCHMKLQDLLRCVGILTDNAIEVVKDIPQREKAVDWDFTVIRRSHSSIRM